jgi:hypothetical protein
MKLSGNTLSIIKNFSTINQNLYVRAGNVLTTMTDSRVVYARAEIDETFPRDFAIYDLSNFLGVLSIMGDDYDLDFQESHVVMKNGKFQITYNYADTSVITVPPDKILDIEPFWSFEFTHENMSTVSRIASYIDNPTLCFKNEDGVVYMFITDPKNDTANTYRSTIEKTDTPVSFDCRMKMENYKMIPGSYLCELGHKNAIHLYNERMKLNYWIAMDMSSKIVKR